MATKMDDKFTRNFVNEKSYISIQISLKFFSKVPIDNKSALVQLMTWCRIGDKPLPESFPTQLADAFMLH